MTNPLPTDPLAILQSLIAAWNRGQADAGRADDGITPHLATANRDGDDRLGRIEARLANLEAAMVALAAERAEKRERKKKARRD